ncbi:MAG TPA: hypothetical protein VM582_06710 [Candidatus Thermoplasmatota archaeon]|nr:hypothetical protein [Candidatus Thermoplasmatota archaeon]
MTAEPAAASKTDADRLARLWEAYKAQEEELRDAMARADRLARDLTDAGQASAERERVIAEKDAEIRRLQETVAHKDARIQELLHLEEDVKALQMYKDRIAELEAAYAQEKERLAKLFLLYEQATKGA